MPLAGYVLGVQFKEVIMSIDHWVAFGLLGIIGINMVRESRENCEECQTEDEALDVKTMVGLAVATSIDALAVGVTFAFLQVKIVPAVSFIGVTTFLISVTGVRIGNIFGAKYKSKAEACRRNHFDFDGCENIVGAFGILGINRIFSYSLFK